MNLQQQIRFFANLLEKGFLPDAIHPNSGNSQFVARRIV